VPGPVTQVVVGAEGDFSPSAAVAQPPDAPLTVLNFPQSLRVITVTGIVSAEPRWIGRTGVIDLAAASSVLPIAYGPVGRFCTVGGLREPRRGHSAVRMADGRVLVVGGGSRLVEIYDPRTASFSGSELLYEGLPTSVSATPLEDGRILVAGGSGAQFVATSGRLIQPVLRLFPPRSGHAAVRLRDGRVLLAGGDESPAASVLYDPRLGQFVEGPAVRPRTGGRAFLTADGTVLLVGGTVGPGSG